MRRPNWSFKLRIMKRNPDRFPMERLAEYMREFAEIIGTENKPVFKGLKSESTGLLAKIPDDRHHLVKARFVDGKTNPNSRAGRSMRRVSLLLGEDGLAEATLVDSAENVIYLFKAETATQGEEFSVFQEGSIDGEITGIVGADETMHLHLRVPEGTVLRLIVRDEHLAREMLQHFRGGTIRVTARGKWTRTEFGWVPESNQCTVSGFEILDTTAPGVVFMAATQLGEIGWSSLDDPLAAWEELRGLH